MISSGCIWCARTIKFEKVQTQLPHKSCQKARKGRSVGGLFTKELKELALMRPAASQIYTSEKTTPTSGKVVKMLICADILCVGHMSSCSKKAIYSPRQCSNPS